MTAQERLTLADVTLAWLCALDRSRPTLGDALPPHAPCRLCGLPIATLVDWAKQVGPARRPDASAGRPMTGDLAPDALAWDGLDLAPTLAELQAEADAHAATDPGDKWHHHSDEERAAILAGRQPPAPHRALRSPRRMGRAPGVRGPFASRQIAWLRPTVTGRREALTRGPHPGRRDRAEPLARPTREGTRPGRKPCVVPSW